MKSYRSILGFISFLFCVHLGFLSPVHAASYALVVGVGTYQNPAVSKLSGPPHDVEKMERLLRQQYCFDVVIKLVDHKATKANILKALRWMASVARPQDRVAFYFSGHGSRVNDTNGDEEDGLDETITPYDVTSKPESHITDDEIGDWIKTVKAERLTVVLDSCHSGTGYRRVGEGVKYWNNPDIRQNSKQVPSAPSTKTLKAQRSSLQLPKRHGFVFIAASASHQFAYDVGRSTDSLMTHHLVSLLQKHPQMSASQVIRKINQRIRGRYNMTPNTEGDIQQPPFFSRRRKPCLVALPPTPQPVQNIPVPQVTPTVPNTPTVLTTPTAPQTATYACSRSGDLCAQLRILNKDGKHAHQFRAGQEIRFAWYTNRDAYVVLVGVDKDGKTTALFPQAYDKVLRQRKRPSFQSVAHEWVYLPLGGSQSLAYFKIEGMPGLEYVELIASTNKRDLPHLRSLHKAKNWRSIQTVLRPIQPRQDIVRARVYYTIIP